MRLRGVFNPKLHFGSAVVLIAIAVWTALTVRGARVDLSSATLDFRLLPVGFLLGLGVGVPEGIWRLRAIRKALPELDGQFFLSETKVLNRFREGENAGSLRRIGNLGAFGVWLMLTLYTDGRVMLMGTLVFYIVGQYLTGYFLPFARLFLELRREHSSS